MAVDEAILESMSREDALPTLRLYSWHPPCLSLGYSQPVSDIDPARLSERGWETVRRPTGGRAILHTDELTYSVTGPVEEPRLAGGVLEGYQRLSEALLKALHLLNIPARASPLKTAPQGSDPKGAVCFEAPSNYEITFDGKKLLGSAQARRKEGVLQHGSFPLSGDLTRITQVLAFPTDSQRAAAAERLLSRATTAEAILGRPLAWISAAQAFVTAFEQALDLELTRADLTLEEKTRAEELARDKYGHPQWTGRV
jgi:lipoate-protein ligase A